MQASNTEIQDPKSVPHSTTNGSPNITLNVDPGPSGPQDSESVSHSTTNGSLPNAASTPSPASGPPRLKKIVPWKGRNIKILLPWDNERGQKGRAPTPMTKKDVEAKMKEWEDLGYDTSGFNLGEGENVTGDAAQGQSCALWPPVQDMDEERQQRLFRVRIPDLTPRIDHGPPGPVKKDSRAVYTDNLEALSREYRESPAKFLQLAEDMLLLFQEDGTDGATVIKAHKIQSLHIGFYTIETAFKHHSIENPNLKRLAQAFETIMIIKHQMNKSQKSVVVDGAQANAVRRLLRAIKKCLARVVAVSISIVCQSKTDRLTCR